MKNEVIWVILLSVIHVWILLLYFHLVTPGSLIVLLYSSNIILVLTVLGKEWFPSEDTNFKQEISSEIARDLKETSHTTLLPRDSRHSWPNLNIRRWKIKNLDRPVEYPLDRIAYLTAKYTNHSTDSSFLLKNSQVKQLVMRSVRGSHGRLLDAVHPCKIVNECYDIYIHRRLAFYMERKVALAGLKQFTKPGQKMRFEGFDEEEMLSLQYSSSRSSVVDSKSDLSDDSSSQNEGNRGTGVKRMWKRVSRVFSRQELSDK